jgi:lipase chaperone LimK
MNTSSGGGDKRSLTVKSKCLASDVWDRYINDYDNLVTLESNKSSGLKSDIQESRYA